VLDGKIDNTPSKYTLPLKDGRAERAAVNLTLGPMEEGIIEGDRVGSARGMVDDGLKLGTLVDG